MERFFDTVDDPGVGDVVLTTTAFNNRLNKASIEIRDVLHMPDIVGVEEVDNLNALQALANKINADAAATGPTPATSPISRRATTLAASTAASS